MIEKSVPPLDRHSRRFLQLAPFFGIGSHRSDGTADVSPRGDAPVTIAPDLMTRFVHDGRPPRSVVVVETRGVYFYCSKTLLRSDLWNPDKRLPR